MASNSKADLQLATLFRSGNSIVLSIPRPQLENLGWGPGDRVMLTIRSGAQLVVDLVGAVTTKTKRKKKIKSDAVGV